MFVWSSFRSRRRTAAPHDELRAETLASLGTRQRWAGYGLCVFQTRPDQGWEHSCGLHPEGI